MEGECDSEMATVIVAPEPHVLLFRRPKNFDEQLKRQELQQMMNGRAAGKLGRKK